MYVVCMFYFVAVNIVVVDAKVITKTALSSQSFKDPGCITGIERNLTSIGNAYKEDSYGFFLPTI